MIRSQFSSVFSTGNIGPSKISVSIVREPLRSCASFRKPSGPREAYECRRAPPLQPRPLLEGARAIGFNLSFARQFPVRIVTSPDFGPRAILTFFAGLALRQVQYAFRVQSSADEIPEAEGVAEGAAAPINPRLRPQKLSIIRQDIAANLHKSAIEPKRAFSPEVERIGDLRISRSNSRAAAPFAAEMDANHSLIANDFAKRSELSRKIDIFKPTVERQVLIKIHTVRIDGRQAQRHIASIEIINFNEWRIPGRSERSQRGARRRDIHPRSRDAIGNNAPGNCDNVLNVRGSTSRVQQDMTANKKNRHQ